jgi:hypothetical protein
MNHRWKRSSFFSVSLDQVYPHFPYYAKRQTGITNDNEGQRRRGLEPECKEYKCKPMMRECVLSSRAVVLEGVKCKTRVIEFLSSSSRKVKDTGR